MPSITKLDAELAIFKTNFADHYSLSPFVSPWNLVYYLPHKYAQSWISTAQQIIDTRELGLQVELKESSEHLLRLIIRKKNN